MKLLKLFAMLLVCCTISFATVGCGGSGAGDDVSEADMEADEAGDEETEE